MNWRIRLPDLLEQKPFRTQAAIAKAVTAATGQKVNQATISRELAAIGAVKIDGVYQLPQLPALAARVHRLQFTAHGCLAVAETDPAHASVLAQSIDDANLPGVLGTIAGDDHVFIALSGVGVQADLRRFLSQQST